MGVFWRLSAGIESATASSAVEFIEALRPSHSHWWDDGVSPWVFRGHAREAWPLLPSAWRQDNLIMKACMAEAARRFDVILPSQSLNWFWHPNYWSASASFGKNDTALARALTISTTAEYLPIFDFAERCDSLGMPVPLMGTTPDPVLFPNWLAEPGNPLVSDELLRFSDLPPTMALAQHHGIPTRFLDWTRNPIAATLFAVENLGEPQIAERLVVWALHKSRAAAVAVEGTNFPGAPNGSPRFDPTITIVRTPARDNPFLVAQSGLFTTIACSGIYFMKSGGRRPSLEEFVAEANPQTAVLRKLTLSHEHVPDLVDILRREGVSRSTLMPTMDNVARDVCQRWCPK